MAQSDSTPDTAKAKSPAANQAQEDKVETIVDGVTENIEEPVQDAADAVESVEDVAEVEIAKGVDKLVALGVPRADADSAVREEIDAFISRQHLAHNGENPPEVVTQALAGAAGSAATHGATKAIEDPPAEPAGSDESAGPSASDEPGEASPAPAQPADTPPQPRHFKDRKITNPLRKR